MASCELFVWMMLFDICMCVCAKTLDSQMITLEV